MVVTAEGNSTFPNSEGFCSTSPNMEIGVRAFARGGLVVVVGGGVRASRFQYAEGTLKHVRRKIYKGRFFPI